MVWHFFVRRKSTSGHHTVGEEEDRKNHGRDKLRADTWKKRCQKIDIFDVRISGS